MGKRAKTIETGKEEGDADTSSGAKIDGGTGTAEQKTGTKGRTKCAKTLTVTPVKRNKAAWSYNKKRAKPPISSGNRRGGKSSRGSRAKMGSGIKRDSSQRDNKGKMGQYQVKVSTTL